MRERWRRCGRSTRSTGVKQHQRRNLARLDLSEKEIALLELLRAPGVYVEAGWPALRKVQSAVRTGEIRVDVLPDAVPGEYNRTVRDNFARLDSDVLKSA